MKLQEIRALSDQELATKINETREELMNFRFQMATGNLPDFTRMKQTRRLIARLLTVQRERQLQVKEGAK
ncbi:MAG: 50S ribosomal protein L29 [Anaerolineales bacterium]